MSDNFKITVSKTAGVWDIEVYDLDDHGQDLPYATVMGQSLEAALHTASHYVMVASS